MPCTAPTTGSPSWSRRTPASTAPPPRRRSRSSTAPASAIGHIGDSRAYLYRRGELRQLTHDHTFVQSLIDEGRITEEQSRTHPHRNLILKALDGIRHEEPDLFEFPAEVGDRIFVCSDGACGTLTDDRMADILGHRHPRLRGRRARPRQPRGRQHRQRHLHRRRRLRGGAAARTSVPLLVGAAADLPRRMPLAGAVGGLFRGHRSGDTGEIPPVPGDIPEGAFAADPIDPEAARYAPRPPSRYTWLRRLMVAAVLLGLAWIVLAAGWSWSQQQFYVAEQDGKVAIFRGIDADLPGISLSHAYETTDVDLDRLSDIDAETGARGHRGRRPRRRPADRGQLRRAPGRRGRVTGGLR